MTGGNNIMFTIICILVFPFVVLADLLKDL